MKTRLFSSLLKPGLMKRIIIGYIMIIVVPSIGLGIFIYRQFYNNMLDEYIRHKQQILNEYYSSLEKDLNQMQGVYNLFQFNTNVIDYLDGNFTSDMESVYTYTKFIKPIYNYVYSSIPYIEDMKIYKSNGNVLSVPSAIVNIVTLENAKIINDITAVNGLWTCRQTVNGDLPQLRFYQKIYTSDFYKGLGILEIEPGPEVLSNYLDNVRSLSGGSDGIYLLSEDNRIIFDNGLTEFESIEDRIDLLLDSQSSGGYYIIKLDGKKVMGNVIAIEELNIKTLVLEYEKAKPKYVEINSISIYLYMIALIIVLSVIYYFITTNMTTRMIRLAKHMRNVEERNLSVYTGKTGKDEIGFLIESYNMMIRRIDELVNTVHKAELLRKEAAYAALQAQIRPHFLFGTLESIRMLAESNNDTQVSNIIFTFGRLMRYSLSSARNEVPLTEEIENVKNYLIIQKIRIGARLEYAFDIKTDTASILCPRFILQPLVENSIVHGISQSRGKGFISILVEKNGDYILIKISDNGCGIPDERLQVLHSILEGKYDIRGYQTENSGFGIYSVSERVRMYYGNDSGLDIISSPTTGTVCTLRLFYKKGGKALENNDSR